MREKEEPIDTERERDENNTPNEHLEQALNNARERGHERERGTDRQRERVKVRDMKHRVNPNTEPSRLARAVRAVARRRFRVRTV